jgi:hypothetical protein
LGESAIAFMNASGYDLMCLGNHEFDHGNENLKKLEGMAEFPFVSANIRLKETGETRFAPSKLFELADGTKVGVFVDAIAEEIYVEHCGRRLMCAAVGKRERQDVSGVQDRRDLQYLLSDMTLEDAARSR